MNCKKCQTSPIWKFTNQRQLCSPCFIKYFEKKARKTIKKYNPIQEGDNVLCKEEPLASFLKEYQERKGKEKKIAIQETLDNISTKIIYLISSKRLNKKQLEKEDIYPLTKNNKFIIRPFYFMLSKEVELYAKLKKIRYTPHKKGNKNQNNGKIMKSIASELDALEKAHPEIKNAIVKGFLSLS